MPVKQKIIIEPFTIVCWHYLPRSGRDAGRATPGENRSIPVKPFTVGLLHSSARHCEPRSGVAIQTNNIPSMASKLCKANKHRFLSLFCDLAEEVCIQKQFLSGLPCRPHAEWRKDVRRGLRKTLFKCCPYKSSRRLVGIFLRRFPG